MAKADGCKEKKGLDTIVSEGLGHSASISAIKRPAQPIEENAEDSESLQPDITVVEYVSERKDSEGSLGELQVHGNFPEIDA